MRKLTKTLAALAIAATPMLATMNTAQASPGHFITKTNWDGFHQCKSYQESGTKSWRATVRGALVDGYGRLSDSGSHFTVSTCFTTKAGCDKWIGRIHHKIKGIDYLRHTSCKLNHA